MIRTAMILAAQKPNPLLAGLVAFWPLNGNVIDLTGQSPAGTPSGGVVFGDGASFTPPARIDCPVTPPLPLGATSRTVAAWVKPQDVVWGTNVLGYGEPSVGRCFDFFQDSSVGSDCRIGLHIYGNSGFDASSGPLAIGQYAHLAVTYHYPDVKFYVNGVLITTWPTSLDTGSSAFRIGAGTWTPRDDYFTGSIKKVGVWNRALPQAQVTALVAGGL